MNQDQAKDLAELLAEQYLREASGDEDEGPLAIPAADEEPEEEIAVSDRDVTPKYPSRTRAAITQRHYRRP